MQKKNWKDFEMKNLGKYHDLYFQSNVLLLANVLEKVFVYFYYLCIYLHSFFRIDTHKLDPAPFPTSLGLACLNYNI